MKKLYKKNKKNMLYLYLRDIETMCENALVFD